MRVIAQRQLRRPPKLRFNISLAMRCGRLRLCLHLRLRLRLGVSVRAHALQSRHLLLPPL